MPTPLRPALSKSLCTNHFYRWSLWVYGLRVGMRVPHG
jgi:hypothetical protein